MSEREIEATPGEDAARAAVERARAGDRSAFDSLVRKYEPALRALALRYVRSEHDAQDVVQLAFVRAFERIASFRGDSHFKTWLYRITVNLALDHARGGKRETVPIEDDVAFTNSLGTERLVAAEIWRKVGARLAELPPRQRLVVELRVYHDLSFEEIAALVGSSEDAAKMNYHHGMKRLRGFFPGP